MVLGHHLISKTTPKPQGWGLNPKSPMPRAGICGIQLHNSAPGPSLCVHPPPGLLARGDPRAPPLAPRGPHHGAWMCYVNPAPMVPDLLLCPSGLGIYFCCLRPLPTHPELPSGHNREPTRHPPPLSPPPPRPPWLREDAAGKGMVFSAWVLLHSFLPLLFLPALLCLFPPFPGMWPVSCPSSPGPGAKLLAVPKRLLARAEVWQTPPPLTPAADPPLPPLAAACTPGPTNLAAGAPAWPCRHSFAPACVGLPQPQPLVPKLPVVPPPPPAPC